MAQKATDAEMERVLRALERVGEFGIAREEFEAQLGMDDREARRIISALGQRGIAAVVMARRGGKEVYRIAKNQMELMEFIATLESYVRETELRIFGLKDAWARGTNGVRRLQDELLEV